MKSILVFVVSVLTFISSPANAKTQRLIWNPQAVAPDENECRYEFEQLYSAGRKGGDRPGQFFQYNVAYQCHVWRSGSFDAEVGVDYQESWDIASETLWDPLQANAQLTYSAREETGWSAALGAQGVGLKNGQNNFNMLYFLGQHRATAWESSLGVFMGNKDVMSGPDGSNESVGALASLRRYIGRGSVSAEFSSGRNRYGFITVGANIKFSERLTGALAVGFANERSVMRDWVLVRILLQ